MGIFGSHVGLIFRILDILKYMGVYEGVWRLFKVYGGYLKYMKVCEGPPNGER